MEIEDSNINIKNKYNLSENILNNNFEILNISENINLKKKKLIEISKNLTKLEYFEILNIIEEDKGQYSENKNGIFINLNNINENTIDKIFNFIDFIKHKKEDLLKHEEIINNAKKNISDIDKNIIYNDIYQKPEIVDKYNEYSDNESECSKNENKYLVFSSDEDEDVENKISLKKKKIKYSGKKAKMIKSIKDTNDNNKIKNRNKKNDE
jgi:hypothetical protein